jgi:hypothetical protein
MEVLGSRIKIYAIYSFQLAYWRARPCPFGITYPKADIRRGHSDVRFVPKADITMILTASLDKCGFYHHKQQMFCLQSHGTPRAEGR